MKANELMIGDWVKFIQSDGQGFYAQVEALNDDGTFAESGFFADNMVRPIPLTAEILEKNGFRKHDFENIEGHHKWSWWRDTGTLVTLWCLELYDDPGDGWMIRIESPVATCCRKVEYVHELQHELRLCGIDHKIEL